MCHIHATCLHFSPASVLSFHAHEQLTCPKHRQRTTMGSPTTQPQPTPWSAARLGKVDGSPRHPPQLGYSGHRSKPPQACQQTHSSNSSSIRERSRCWSTRRSHHSGQCPVAVRAVREQKDPARFRNMDEAREYLMQSGRNGGGPIAGALNWLSNAAFGAGKAGAHVGSMYRQWLSSHSAASEHSRYAA